MSFPPSNRQSLTVNLFFKHAYSLSNWIQLYNKSTAATVRVTCSIWNRIIWHREHWIPDPQWRSLGDLQSNNQASAVGEGLGKLSGRKEEHQARSCALPSWNLWMTPQLLSFCKCQKDIRSLRSSARANKVLRHRCVMDYVKAARLVCILSGNQRWTSLPKIRSN